MEITTSSGVAQVDLDRAALDVSPTGEEATAARFLLS